jgi:hypothetical protein
VGGGRPVDYPYHELGATYFDGRERQDVELRLVRRLEALGNTVTLKPNDLAAKLRR